MPVPTVLAIASGFVVVATGLAVGPLRAGTLDTVRQANTVHCGAAARAGFADVAADGRITGLGVDLCRALTIAVLGPAGRTEFHIYDSDRDYDAARTGRDEVAFLTASELGEHGLAAAVVPGPAVFIAELSMLVHPGAATSLADATACFMNGSPAHQALEAWAGRTHTDLVRTGFQEDAELQDGFDARRCDAMAGEASELAAFRAQSPTRADARILLPLGLMPVFATTPVTDGGWAALAGWTLSAVVQSEAAPGPWRSDLPGVAQPGLHPGWPAAVVATLGDYAAMLDRNLGRGSKLGLPPGPNAPWPAGLIVPPGPR